MNAVKFAECLDRLEATLRLEPSTGDLYQRLDNLLEQCKKDRVLRLRVESYGKFLLSELAIMHEKKEQGDVSEGVVHFLFIAVLNGIHRSTMTHYKSGASVIASKRQHWLPVALLKQFQGTKDSTTPKSNQRAFIYCSHVKDKLVLESKISDVSFIHKEDHYYDDVVERMFAFSETHYGNYMNQERDKGMMEQITLTSFVLLSVVRFPLRDGSFRAGDLKTTLSTVFSFMDYLGEIHADIKIVGYKLPLDPFSSPVSYTEQNGNNVFFYPLGSKTGFILSSQRMPKPFRYIKKFKNRMIRQAFEQNGTILGIQDLEQYR